MKLHKQKKNRQRSAKETHQGLNPVLHVCHRKRSSSPPEIAGCHCWEKKNDENEKGQRGLDGNDRGSEVEEGDVGVGALVPVEVAGDEEEGEREMNEGGCWKKGGGGCFGS